MAAELDRLTASVTALQASVDVLFAKPQGIDPALLNPVSDQVDALKIRVDAVIVPQ